MYNFKGCFDEVSVKRFLKWAADKNASDILIQGGDYIWAEVYGRQVKMTAHKIQQGHLNHIIQSLWQADIISKIRGGNDADRAFELTERDDIGIPRGETYRFRTNFTQARVSSTDEAFVITLRVISRKLPRLEDQDIDPDMMHALFPIKGLGIICGPTGSGKTTLLSAIYRYCGENFPHRKVITYEDPIENVLGGEHWIGPQPAQSEIGRDIPDFASGLRNAMRRKPAVIGIGEARDLETIDAMIQAAQTGHLCVATSHTDSIAETISRLIQEYPPMAQSAIAARLLGNLRFICVQRLVKTTDGKRKAVREFLEFDDDLRNDMAEIDYTKWGRYIRNLLKDRKETISDKAWELFISGCIEKEEFIELAGWADYKKRIKENG